MRLNLGSGILPLDGYTNVDQHESADVKGDIRELKFWDVAEVRMSHLLEHISYHETVPVLERIRSWMIPAAPLIVEVPDMTMIMAESFGNPLWVAFVYGSQQHEGEYHRAGFTAHLLIDVLTQAGFREVEVRAFRSDHHHRVGMPCLEGTARA